MKKIKAIKCIKFKIKSINFDLQENDSKIDLLKKMYSNLNLKNLNIKIQVDDNIYNVKNKKCIDNVTKILEKHKAEKKYYEKSRLICIN